MICMVHAYWHSPFVRSTIPISWIPRSLNQIHLETCLMGWCLDVQSCCCFFSWFIKPDECGKPNKNQSPAEIYHSSYQTKPKFCTVATGSFVPHYAPMSEGFTAPRHPKAALLSLGRSEMLDDVVMYRKLAWLRMGAVYTCNSLEQSKSWCCGCCKHVRL